jgi:hypothetical protein
MGNIFERVLFYRARNTFMDDGSTPLQTEDLYERIRQLALDNEIDQALYQLTKIEDPVSILIRLARDLALDLALALALALALTLAHARDQDHDLDHDLALALALALSFALDLTRYRGRSLDLDRAMAMARELDHDLALARELATDLNLDLDFADIVKVLEQSHHIIQFIRAALTAEEHPIEITTVVFTKYPPLTTHVLAQIVMPYLKGMIALQQIIMELRGEFFVEPIIRELSQRSSLSIRFTGRISEALIVVRSMLIPWRRQRVKQLAELEAEEKRFEIAKAEAELQEIYARTTQIENDPEVGIGNREPTIAELERAQLENERLRLILYKEKIVLAEAVKERFTVGLPEQEPLIYINQLVDLITLFCESPLEID